MTAQYIDPPPRSAEELYKMYREKKAMREKSGSVRLTADTEGTAHAEVGKGQG